MSGFDETAGNADDYTVVLTDAGQDAGADIVIDFDDSMTAFAVTFISGVGTATPDHGVITSSSIFFHDDMPGSFEWFFTPEEVDEDCGNNIVEGNEVCDEGDDNGTTTCGCTDSCTLPGSGTECRESTGSCDPAESCDGAGSCDDDVLEPEFTACGDQSDTQCSNPNSCSDAGVCLARNEAPGTSCEATECTDPDTCDDSGKCTQGQRLTTPECVPVGGELIPLDTTSLILASTQTTFSWLIPITISVIGIAIVIATRFSKLQPE